MKIDDLLYSYTIKEKLIINSFIFTFCPDYFAFSNQFLYLHNLGHSIMIRQYKGQMDKETTFYLICINSLQNWSKSIFVKHNNAFWVK